MRILHVSMEIAPWAKVGGLADVLSGLGAAQARAGERVLVVVPRHGSGTWTRESIRTLPGSGARFHLGGLDFEVELAKLDHDGGFEVILVDCPALYDREEIYGTPRTRCAWPDALVRRSVLCHTALYAALQQGFSPDVVHAHDAAAAITVPLLRRAFHHTPLQKARCVLSIHNLGYLETFPFETLPFTGLSPCGGDARELYELEGAFSAMKGAVLLADRVQTVSPTYAREVTTDPRIGGPLGGILRARGEDFVGLLNGVDLETWNPCTDPHLAAPFHSDDMSGREACRRDLWQEASFCPADPGEPEPAVVGVVSRLAHQKGLDLLAGAIPTLAHEGLRFAIAGTGDPWLEDELLRLGLAHPGRIWTALNPAEEMARRIFAGSDLFCVPSRYEPCGLTQQYALRYGSIPVVRRTGGLADTVDEEVGFLFDRAEPEALAASLREAGAHWRCEHVRRTMQHAGMARARSWNEAARELRERVYGDVSQVSPLQPGAGGELAPPQGAGSAQPPP